jgi:hypothetical protein
MRGEPSDWPTAWPVHAPDFGVVTPTRLPPSRLLLHGLGSVVSSRHDLLTGRLHLDTTSGAVTVAVLGGHDVIVISGRGGAPSVTLDWLSDPANWARRPGGQPFLAPHPATLFAGYTAATRSSHAAGDTIGQAVPDGGSVALAWRSREVDDAWVIGLSMAAIRRGDAAEAMARADEELVAVLDHRDAAWDAHDRHWAGFHHRSWVSVPTESVEALWYAEMAKLGSAVRGDGPVLGLQGPWSPDGRMPPWGGDLHHNVNVQFSYAPVAVTNHVDLAESLCRYVTTSMPAWREMATSLFDDAATHELFVPSATDDEGSCRYEYALVNLAFSSGPWLGQVLHTMWRHTGDGAYLADVVAPFLRGIAPPLVRLLEPDERGRLHVAAGYSPELVPRDAPAWGRDPAIDLAMLQWLFDALAEVDEALGDAAADPARWRDLSSRLAPIPSDPPLGSLGGVLHGAAGGWRVRDDVRLDRSHRHHSHLSTVHPLRQATADHPDHAVRALVASSFQQLMLAGPGEWVGFSVPWAASLGAYSGFADVALGHLRDYAERWLGPSTFHLQASHSRQVPTIWNELGGHLGGDALSLEAGFAFVAAVADLLLQDHGGVVRVFPALPSSWGSASFAGLRAAGGFEVAARAHEGRAVAVRVLAHRDASLVLRMPADGQMVERRRELHAGEEFSEFAPGWTLEDLTPVTLPTG